MNISTKAWTVAYKIMGAAIVLMVLGAIVLVSLNNAQLRAENQDMYADLQASQENAQSLYEQLLAEGVEPEGEPPAEVAPGPAGQKGDRGLPGQDGEDGTDSTVPGPPGVPGRDGQDSTVPGPAGAQGRDGKDSTVPGPAGPAGPAGKDGADSTTPGPQGEQGPAGPAGADGRGIESLYCEDTTGRWTVTYTDSTTADAGACRTPLIEGVTP